MQVTLSAAQEHAIAQMREVLQDDYLAFAIASYSASEDFGAGTAHVTCTLDVNGGKPITVEGEGVGMIDAVFGALRGRFAPEYPSLESIRFTGFSIKGPLGSPMRSSATDAAAEARVTVTNSYGNEFVFSAITESVSRSSLQAVLAAVEYFVNSERAYVTMYKALEHYRKEGRVDLVGKYTALLAEMVKNTSYSSAVERLEGESGGGTA